MRQWIQALYIKFAKPDPSKTDLNWIPTMSSHHVREDGYSIVYDLISFT